VSCGACRHSHKETWRGKSEMGRNASSKPRGIRMEQSKHSNSGPHSIQHRHSKTGVNRTGTSDQEQRRATADYATVWNKRGPHRPPAQTSHGKLRKGHSSSGIRLRARRKSKGCAQARHGGAVVGPALTAGAEPAEPQQGNITAHGSASQTMEEERATGYCSA
jgi:hypothetical protein